MDGAEQCIYEGFYRDLSGTQYWHICGRPAVSDGYCIFHDGKSHIENEEAVKDAFIKEFDTGDEEVFFMGCNVPHIDAPVSGRHRLIHFNNAVFHGSAPFYNLRADLVDFSGAKFLGEFSMERCVTKKSMFKESSFIRRGSNVKDDGDVKDDYDHADVLFYLCTFEEFDAMLTTADATVEFNDCNIEKSIFKKCTFKKKFSAVLCSFGTYTNFKNSSFSDDILFDNTSFRVCALFRDCKFAAHMEFHHVDFQDQRSITMPVQMHDVSLIGTDVERIRFGADTMWETEDGQPMLDVRGIKDGERKSLAESVYVCRNLRENADYRLVYSDGGRFFRWEMDLHRNYRDDGGVVRKKNWLARNLSLRGIYRHISNYGDNIYKVVAMWPVLSASAFAYFLLAPDAEVLDRVRSLGGCWYGDPCGIHPVPEAVLHKVFNVMGQANQSEPMGHVFRALTLLVIGMSYISTRRRLERRLRH